MYNKKLYTLSIKNTKKFIGDESVPFISDNDIISHQVSYLKH
jgi:hypothetical protein